MEANDPSSVQASPAYSLWDLALYALRLGTFGFGGPVALVGYMHRDLVERRKWISEPEYKEGLALAQLMPGPLAAQLAIYLGFVPEMLEDDQLGRLGIVFVFVSISIVSGLSEGAQGEQERAEECLGDG